MYAHLLNRFKRHGIICLKSRQYHSKQYQCLLSSADLFVMPSRLESTSLAALEALWFGVPSILTPHCGVDPFVAHRHGYQLLEHNPAALAQAMYNLCTSSEKREFFRACLAKDRHLFSWNQYMTAYQEFLASL